MGPNEKNVPSSPFPQFHQHYDLGCSDFANLSTAIYNQANTMSQLKKHISFSKKMYKSERIPRWFCDVHLPCHDDNIVLVDESEREFYVRYVMKEHRLQRGWRGFVVTEGLLEGDTLVFDYIDQCKFKVYITRSCKSIENEVQISELLDFGLPSISGDSQAVMQANMSPQKYTSFRKKMHSSNVSNKFYLRLPKGFCDVHLPCKGANIVLVDESEREYNVKYGVNQNRLQRGWKDFVIAHGLLQGDAVDFDLIDKCKFKVHIARTSKSMKNDSRINMLVDLVKKEDIIEENARIDNSATQKYPVSHGRAVDNHQIQHRSNQANVEKCHPLPQVKLPMKEATPNILTDEHKAALDRIKELEMQLGVSNALISSSPKLNVDKGKWPKILEDVGESEEEIALQEHCFIDAGGQNAFLDWKKVREDIVFEENMKHVCTRSRSPEIYYGNGDSSLNVTNSSNNVHLSGLNFNDIEGFEDFKINVNGETLDSEIPENIRKKYYQLCCSQKKFIHDSVMKGQNNKFVSAMIHEIVTIADAMKAASISTSRGHLECMEKTLKSFEDLGMSVGLVRAKIGSLITFSRDHDTVEEATKMNLVEIETERKAIDEKRAKIDKLEEKVDALNEKREELRLAFQKVAGFPW